MKKVFIVLLLMLSTSVSLFVNATPYKEFCTFSNTKEILSSRVLKDFATHSFHLYELNEGYAIYSINKGEEIFIEGSLETNSPYFLYSDIVDLYYLGPGEYFYQENDKAINILTLEKLDIPNINYSYELPMIPSTYSTIQPNSNSTLTDTDGFTTIKDAFYFEKLIQFPYNYFGDCGLVALSILLGYLDTFHNDNFIPNDLSYTGKYYKLDSEDKWVLNYEIEESFIKKTKVQFSEESTYEYGYWDFMPGPTHALRDYLFDNYLHTYLISNGQGYPMFDEELKATMNDYILDNCPELKSKINIKSGNVFYTHQRPKEYINEGIPTILVLYSYNSDSSVEKVKAHDVVAYGYKDDTFLVHMGWRPGTNETSKVIISNATIYGFYAVEYTGEHQHSKNIYMRDDHHQRNICGCGYIQEEYLHKYEYESINFKKHLCYCSCGYSFEQNHTMIPLNDGSLNNTASICRNCGFTNVFK